MSAPRSPHARSAPPRRNKTGDHRRRSLAPRGILLFLCLVLFGLTCVPAAAPPAPNTAPPDPVVLSIVGTSDLHGHIKALPLLAGHLNSLRRARAGDGGVVLVDAGDMFQGTLESNLVEGESVVAAYAAIGYDAVAIGNHEFDFGPEGPPTTARTDTDDPRGALRARIAAAPFPFLSANIRTPEGTHAGLGVPSTLIERAGVKVGIVGVTTESTPYTTIAANLVGLEIAPLAAAIADEAARLRAHGAAVVVVAAHAGGRCTDLDHPDDLSSCKPGEEIMKVAAALPPGAVDVIVAGHTHQAMAHRVAGVPVVQSYALGVAYGRVDLLVDRTSGHVLSTTIFPPRRLCSLPDASPEGPLEACDPRDDHGEPVRPDPAVARAIAPALAQAEAVRDRPLGPRLAAPFVARRRGENAVGNFFVDLMLRARPGVDAAVVNGGGLRADLPPGPLRYGALYEAFPFDNRFARVRLTAREFAQVIAGGLQHRAFLSLGGLVAEARCDGDTLVVTLFKDGKPLAPEHPIVVLASDFLATGGDRAFLDLQERGLATVEIEDDPPIREAMADELRKLGEIELDPRAYHDPTRPRIRAPGPAPVRCP